MNQISKKFFSNNQLKSLRGFTLVEVLIVMAIIVILSGMSLTIHHSGTKTYALQRSAQKLAQDIDYAKTLAMNSQTFQGINPPTTPPGGYGIHLIPNTRSYILYADLNGNKKYDQNYDGIVQNISLEKGINIYNASSFPLPLSINFTPPSPLVTLSSGDQALIILCIQDTNCVTPQNTKTIRVYKTGLIEVE